MLIRCTSKNDAERKTTYDDTINGMGFDDHYKKLILDVNKYAYELKDDGWLWLIIGRSLFFLATLLGVLVPVLAGLQGQESSMLNDHTVRILTVSFSIVSLFCNTINFSFKWTEQGHTMLEAGFRVEEHLRDFFATVTVNLSPAEKNAEAKKFHIKVSKIIRKAKTATIDHLAGEQEDNHNGRHPGTQGGTHGSDHPDGHNTTRNELLVPLTSNSV